MRYPVGLFFIACLLSLNYVHPSYAGFGEALYLSENPPAEHRGDHNAGQRGGGGDHSEHRAAPVKKFYLNIHDLSDNTKVYIVRPDGSMAEGRLSHEEGPWSVTFGTKPMDGSLEGIFNVYVVNKQIVNGTLLVRTAKMNIINHSCQWGHKYKFDKERQRPKNLQEIPLEIVGHDLWDGYFHTHTMSGDNLAFSVLKDGTPAKNASLRLETQTGWVKILKTGNDGKGSVQLVRDYYPDKWKNFKARKKGYLLLTAEYEIKEKGEFEGMKYSKVKLITTFPWKYQPQREEYTSYAYGLSIAVLFAIVAGLAVYIHRERRKKPYREVVFDEKD